MEEQTKICTGCEAEKPFSAYSKHPKGKFGLQPKCRECRNTYSASYYEVNKASWQDRETAAREADVEAVRKKNREAATRWRSKPENIRQKKMAYIEARYGISYAEYEAMETAQKGLCKICHQPPNGRWKRLAVDHDHLTGKVRGLLCHSCNAGLGHFKDSVDALRSAISYIVGG